MGRRRARSHPGRRRAAGRGGGGADQQPGLAADASRALATHHERPSRRAVDGAHQRVDPAGRSSLRGRRVVAVASRDLSRAQQLRGRARRSSAHTAPTKTCCRTPTSTRSTYRCPTHLHVEWSEHALAAGKHVLCEKPLARSRHEAERAFDAAERAGRILAEAFMYRHHPQTLAIKSLLEDGAVGPLRLIRASQSFPIEAKTTTCGCFASSRAARSWTSGATASHFARFIAGEPERVYGEQRLNDRRRRPPVLGHDALRRRRTRCSSTRGSTCPSATSSSWSAPTARSRSTIRG